MLAERGAAPAPVSRTHRSGRPRATVRSNYVGLPSMAGRGRTNAGGSPRDQGGEEPAVRPRKRGPEDTNRRGGAPKGDALSAEGAPAAAREVRKDWRAKAGDHEVAPFGAPLPILICI